MNSRQVCGHVAPFHGFHTERLCCALPLGHLGRHENGGNRWGDDGSENEHGVCSERAQ